MDDNIQSVASAVVLPDWNDSPEITTQTAPTGQKRRQTSVSSNTSKRPRLSTDASLDLDEASRDEPPVDRRRSRQISGQAEERSRGKRLFGGLLSTLSQSSNAGAGAAARERRKAEIEKKQAEKLRQKDEEYDEEKKKRLEGLIKTRRREQWVWDEQAMRVRHSNMLAKARFLQTESEPKLYYKPWELLPEEEDRIEKQVADAESQIDRELAEFEEKRKNWLEEEDARDEATGTNTEIVDAKISNAKQDGTTEKDKQESAETVGAEPTPSDAATKPTNDDAVDNATADNVNSEHVERHELKEAANANDEEKEAPQDEDGKNAAEDNADHDMDAGEDAVIY